MLNSLKNKVKTQIVDSLQSDKDIYYGRFKGTADFLPLLVKNIMRPSRFVEKARFGQVPLLPQFMQAGKPYPKEFDRYIEEQGWSEHFKELCEVGITVVPGYFSAARCDGMIEMLGLSDALVHEADGYVGDITPKFNELTRTFWMDMACIAVCAKYMQRFPYARCYPNVSVANPSFNSLPTRQVDTPHDIRLNVGWHYDTPNLLQFHVLLNDVADDGSCMQVIAKSHRNHHLKLTGDDYWLSDEYVVKRKLRVVNCAGKKGTVYFFDSNAYHRLRAVKGRPRAMLKCEFTPGNNILMSCKTVAASLSQDVNALDNLTPIQREILSGLYPAAPFGGFCYERGTLSGDHSRL
jgi:hypothetical protein